MSSEQTSSAWILSTKREGDRIGNWVVAKLFDDNRRELTQTERCEITSFCYPRGAKLVRARLSRPELQKQAS